MKRTIQQIIICFVVISCNNDNSYKNFSNAEFNIEIKESDFYKAKKLSDIIDSIEYIPLETSEDCIIGKITRIKHHNNRFYIFDQTSKSIFIFNEQGKFVSKYSKTGKGPFEYVTLQDMDIDSEGNCYLLETRRIIKLDSNLTPLKEIFLPFGTVRFATIRNNEIALVNLGREDEIHIISNDGKELTSYLPYSGIERRSELKPFIKSGTDLLYKPVCSDDIFRIGPDSISLYTRINFEKPIPKKYWINKKPTDFLDFSMYMGNIYIYCETKSFIFFRFNYDYKGDDGPFYTLYSKKGNSVIVYTNRIENDCYMSKYPPLISEVTMDGRFIATIDATFFCESEKKHPDLFKRYSGVTEMSNPVIALLKFKK